MPTFALARPWSVPLLCALALTAACAQTPVAGPEDASPAVTADTGDSATAVDTAAAL